MGLGQLPNCGRFRVSYYMDRKNMCGSFRLIPSEIQSMEQLRLPKSIEKFCTLSKGLVLVAAIEVLVVNAAVSALIREAKVSQIMSIMQTAKKEGMAILNQELARLVKEDLVEPEEAWRTAVDRGDLIKQYESAGISFTPPEE